MSISGLENVLRVALHIPRRGQNVRCVGHHVILVGQPLVMFSKYPALLCYQFIPPNIALL